MDQRLGATKILQVGRDLATGSLEIDET